jgi:endonuclease V-like protein UPF0215 family
LLKKEIRVLGLSFAAERDGRVQILGVVFRGSLWLDGAFTCIRERSGHDYVSALASAIKQSSQYSQLRAVILCQGRGAIGSGLDIRALADKTKLPVIAIVESRLSRYKGKTRSTPERTLKLCTVNMQGKTVYLLTRGLTSEVAREIFMVSCAPGSHVPEAVRVAKLLTEHAMS